MGGVKEQDTDAMQTDEQIANEACERGLCPNPIVRPTAIRPDLSRDRREIDPRRRHGLPASPAARLRQRVAARKKYAHRNFRQKFRRRKSDSYSRSGARKVYQPCVTGTASDAGTRRSPRQRPRLRGDGADRV